MRWVHKLAYLVGILTVVLGIPLGPAQAAVAPAIVSPPDSAALPLAGGRTLDVMFFNDGASFEFVPSNITIVRGDTVDFMNHDAVGHQLVLRAVGSEVNLLDASQPGHAGHDAGLGLGAFLHLAPDDLRAPVLEPLGHLSHRFLETGVFEVLDPWKADRLGLITVVEKDTAEARSSFAFSQTYAEIMDDMMGPSHKEEADASATEEPAPTVSLETVCPPDAPVVSFNVVAIDVDITLNRFGDHDPEGKMYVLEENLAGVSAQERAPLPRRVSTGLRDDPIQPLVVRANMGSCVVISFRNGLRGAPASMHVHRAAVDPSEDGSAVGDNTDSTVNPGETTTYTWFLPDTPEMEGAVYFHSHGDTRQQTQHGLFGALIAEPQGSTFLHPGTLQPINSGWESVIQPASGPAFRELAIAYHEIGDETFRPLDREGNQLPLNDPETHIYRPCTRALNYRSECFMRRMGLGFDESMGYSSYVYGDPATPMPRAYLGDPYKTRLIHGGGELFHSHHHHGGTVRWPFQPAVEPSLMFLGLDKTPPIYTKTQRLDVQALGPGEMFSLEHECGAGGCQQVAGDFLYHCHFPHHYVAGMWGFYRTFNTLQPDLRELPDRAGRTAQAVNSLGLLGKALPSGKVLTPDNIEAWVESLLPAQGVSQGYDATVWDWVKETGPEGTLYFSEPEDTRSWPNFTSPTPGERREIMFDPQTGRPAYPLLTPHLAKRPPFAPGAHGPAPYLTTSVDANSLPTNNDFATVPLDPERPRDALCPAGNPVKRYNVVAITLPVAYNTFGNVDPDGQIFVLAEDVGEVLAGRKPAQPLVIRANVRDCVYVTLTSRLVDNQEVEFLSKVNMHPHFFQFDVQATDGVITGLAFEQSVRPFPTEGRVLARPAIRGEQELVVTRTRSLRPGIWLGVGLGTNGIELHKIAAISGNTVRLTEPLVRDHAAAEAVGVEFVQYAWYPDVNLGTVFWHDHAFGATSWGHGLFGTTVVEPQGSTYHDPATGSEIRSGPIADIHTQSPVAIDLPGQSFREMVLQLQDSAFDETSSFNLRREPFKARLKQNDDPSLLFSSVAHGDPVTPLLRAYEGDPVVIRVIQTGTNEVLTFRITGRRFKLERFPDAALSDSLHISIAERFDVVLEGGAGKAGDYLYYNAEANHFAEGMWGIFRVHDKLRSDLQVLPSRSSPPSGVGFPTLTRTGGPPPRASNPGISCPAGAPVRQLNVVALETKIEFNDKVKDNGKIFALAQDERAITAGSKRPDPLVLRAAAGDCLEVTLTNRLDHPVSLHAGRLLSDPQRSLGITVGYSFDQSAPPRGGRITYRWFADRELGAGILADFANGIEGMEVGLYGAIVVSPQGSRFFDPATGREVSAGWQAVVRNDDPSIEPFRDFALVFQEQEPLIGKNIMPYKREPDGITAINYRTEPLEERLKRSSNTALAFSSRVHGEPETPIMEAIVGEPVRVHAVMGFGYQAHTFFVSGHYWHFDPSIPGANLFATRAFAPHTTVDCVLEHGTGGMPSARPGDYLFGDHRLPFLEAGAWGILRIHDTTDRVLLPLAR